MKVYVLLILIMFGGNGVLHSCVADEVTIVPDNPSHSGEIDDASHNDILIVTIFAGLILIILLFALSLCLKEWWKIQYENEKIYKQHLLQTDIIRNLPVGVYAKDVVNRYEYVLFNPKMEEITGALAKDIIGTVHIFPHEVTQQSLHNSGAVSFEEECVKTREMITHDWEIKTPNGTKVLRYLYSPVVYPDSTVRLMIGHVKDITKQRKLEQDLDESLLRVQALFKKNLCGMAVLEPIYVDGEIDDALVLEINQKYAEFIGQPAEKIIGRKISKVFESEPEYFEINQKTSNKLTKMKVPIRIEYVQERTQRYYSGQVFMFGSNREYLGIIWMETTHLVEVNKEEEDLLNQINNDLVIIATASEEIKEPVLKLRSLILKETTAAYKDVIEEQTHMIESLVTKLEKGILESDKIDEYLRKHHGVRLTDEKENK